VLYAVDDSSLRPRGGLRVAVSRLNCEAGRNGRQVLRIGRNDREGASLSGMGKAMRTIGPDMSRIGTIDTKAVLFAAGFFVTCERTVRFIGARGLRDRVCRSRVGLRFRLGITRGRCRRR